MHLFSVAATLVALARHRRSLTQYLADHWDFCRAASCDGGDDPVHRLAFLLYLLTYWNVPNDSNLPTSRSDAFSDAITTRDREMAELLRSPDAIEREYRRWLRSGERYGKRLWAAFRDYVKPGSVFRAPFLNALRATGCRQAAAYFRRGDAGVLGALEVPGDVWNNLFFTGIFREPVRPRTLRVWHDALKAEGRLPTGAHVEQLDVSFEYAAAMCRSLAFDTCVFRRDTRIGDLCPPRHRAVWRGRWCPVGAYLCGYEAPCSPDGCPVYAGLTQDLCRGCAPDICERG